MGNYLLIMVADILFSMQFLFTKLYKADPSERLAASLIFSMGSSFVIALAAFAIQGFQVTFTAFSLLMAVLMAIVIVSLAYFSIASLAYVNLSLYSVFMMMGGMLLPFLYGIIFLREPMTWGKGLCVVLVLCAMLLSIQKADAKKGAAKFYVAVFIVNGLMGIVSKIHQIYPEKNTPTVNFLLLSNAVVVLLCVLIIGIKSGKKGFQPVKNLQNWICMGGNGLSSGLAEFASMTAMTALPASIQFSLVSGGVIVFSTLISILRGEKQTMRTIISICIAMIAMVVVGL